jgi:hypothetical protein
MTNKTLATTLLAGSMIFCSCGKDDSEKKAAEALDAKVDSAITAQNYEEAITLIDSLNKAYPLQIDIRKGTIAKRAQAMESWAQVRIPELDCKISNSQEAIAALEQNFKFVQPSSTLAGYYIYKTCTYNDVSSFAAKSSIQPRVNSGDDAEDTPWTLAVNAGKDISLNKLVISLANGQQYTIDIPVSDGTMASIAPERVNELGKYLNDNPQSAAASATASGSKGSVKISLSVNDCEAIAASWHLAAQKDSLRQALIDRERVERQLQIARDQKANAPAANSDQANQK